MDKGTLEGNTCLKAPKTKFTSTGPHWHHTLLGRVHHSHHWYVDSHEHSSASSQNKHCLGMYSVYWDTNHVGFQAKTPNTFNQQERPGCLLCGQVNVTCRKFGNECPQEFTNNTLQQVQRLILCLVHKHPLRQNGVPPIAVQTHILRR